MNYPGLQEFILKSQDGEELHSFFFKNPESSKVILFLHGNAGHAYHRLPAAAELHRRGFNVLLIDYRGYGKSSGSPSEEGIGLDAQAAWDYLVKACLFTEENIFVFGRSIGSVAAIDLCVRSKTGGLILVSPLSSASDMAEHMGLGWLSWYVGGALDNCSRVADVRCPVLILHGDRDRVIPLSLGLKVFDALPERRRSLKILEGCGHNDIEEKSGFLMWDLTMEFIHRESPQ